MFLYTPNRVFLTTRYKYGHEEPQRILSVATEDLVDGVVDLSLVKSCDHDILDTHGTQNNCCDGQLNTDTGLSDFIVTDEESVGLTDDVSEIKGKQRADLSASPGSSPRRIDTESNKFENTGFTSNEYTDGLTSYYNGGVFSCSASLSTNPKPDSYDLIDFLAVVQHRRVDMVPFRWDNESDIGVGGTARISESVSAETSLGHKLCFAFKRFQREGPRYEADRNKIFQALLSEVYILGHPVVQQHPNINSLKGIAWDTVYDEVWPVLVFEKTEYGDLKQFMATSNGQGLSFTQRVRLCYEIGNAVNLMHACHAIHGDLKPQNILIFKNHDNQFSVKVTDFGYSTVFTQNDDDIRITLPQSWPWTAPEIEENPTVSFEQAKAADIFSYGLLCFWLLFYERLRDIASSEPGYDPRLAELLVIDRARKMPNLEELIEKDLRSFVPVIRKNSPNEKKPEEESPEDARFLGPRDPHRNEIQGLEYFFVGCLWQEPSLREMEIRTLPHVFGFPGKPLPLMEEYGNLALLKSKATFNLASMLSRFRFCPPELTKAIFSCLQTRSLSSDKGVRASAAYDLALCYQQGFGVSRDQEKCESWLNKSDRNPKDLESLVDMIESDTTTFYSFNNTRIVFIDSEALTQDSTNLSIESGGYYEHELFSATTSAWIHKELGIDVKEIHVLRHPDPFSEAAEKELQENIQALQARLGWEDNSTTETSTITIPFKSELRDSSRRFRKLPQLEAGSASPDDDFESINRNISKKSTLLGSDHEWVIRDMKMMFQVCIDREVYLLAEFYGLFVVYMEKKVYGMDNPITLGSMEKLYGTYLATERWEDAEALIVQVLDARIRVLDVKHEATLRVFISMEDLVIGYDRAKRVEKSIPILERLVDLKKQVYSCHNARTLRAMQYLAIACIFDDSLERLQQAEVILDRLVDESRFSFGGQSIELADNTQLLAHVRLRIGTKAQRIWNFSELASINMFQMRVDWIRSQAKENGNRPEIQKAGTSCCGTVEEPNPAKWKDTSRWMADPDPGWGSQRRLKDKSFLADLREIIWDYLKDQVDITSHDESIKAVEKDIEDAEDLALLGASRIMELGNLYMERFMIWDEVGDIDNAIAWLKIALEIFTDDAPERSECLGQIGSYYLVRYRMTDLLEDLSNYLSHTEAIFKDYRQFSNKGINRWARGLVKWYPERHRITGDVEDLNSALEWCRNMFFVAPMEDEPDCEDADDGSVSVTIMKSRDAWSYQWAYLQQQKSMLELPEFEHLYAMEIAIDEYEEIWETNNFVRTRSPENRIRIGDELIGLYNKRHKFTRGTRELKGCVRILEDIVQIAKTIKPGPSNPEYSMHSREPHGLALARLACGYFYLYKDSGSADDLELAAVNMQEAERLIFSDSIRWAEFSPIQSQIRVAQYRVKTGKLDAITPRIFTHVSGFRCWPFGLGGPHICGCK